MTRESVIIHLVIKRFLSFERNTTKVFSHMLDYNDFLKFVSLALFVDLEADFHARVPVVICKEKNRWVSISSNKSWWPNHKSNSMTY